MTEGGERIELSGKKKVLRQNYVDGDNGKIKMTSVVTINAVD
jgi:hypothetical protein